jgi:hypothetical protein
MSTYSGADFLPAVAVLGYALQQHASHLDRVLLVLDSLTLEPQELKVIENVGWRIKRAEAWPLPDRPLLPRWETALLKLQAWVCQSWPIYKQEQP